MTRWVDTPARKAARERNHLIMRLRSAWYVLYNSNVILTAADDARAGREQIDKILIAFGAESEGKRRSKWEKELYDLTR